MYIFRGRFTAVASSSRWAIPSGAKTVSRFSAARFTTTVTTPATTNTYNPAHMATARKVLLSPHSDTGVWSTGISESAAKTASAVLQEDLEKHHVYFNDMGFHGIPPFTNI
jgi:hypothetical protein